MRLSVSSSGLNQDQATYPFGSLDSQSSSLCFFKTIPPERMGVDGEYDHSGLAKRVLRELRQRFPKHLERLRITQRGTVVVLRGQVLDQSILTKMVEIASKMPGALCVETHGVRLIKH